MIYVYMANASELPDPLEYPEYMEGLPAKRKEKIQRYKQKKSRQECLCAGLLLNHVLNLHGFSAETIRYGEKGKPEADGFYFNLSHSGGIAVCAIGTEPVGCDAEKVKEAPMRIAEWYFCENELRYLQQTTGLEQDEAFFRLWTMKESYMKMTGEGLTVPLNQYEMILGNEVRVARDGKIQNCYMKEYEIPGYKLTVCAKTKEFSELKRINLSI